jgi:hypothetical protein
MLKKAGGRENCKKNSFMVNNLLVLVIADSIFLTLGTTYTF